MKKKEYGALNIYDRYLKRSLQIYYICIALILIGLFFSRGLISTGFIAFIVNWFLEGDYKNKWSNIKANKDFLIVSLIPFIHLIGLINTENIPYGLIDLKIKLPLLLPIFFISQQRLLNQLNINKILNVFLVSIILVSIYGSIRFNFLESNNSIEDLSKMAYLGQNIQISIFSSLAACIIIYRLFFNSSNLSLQIKALYSISLVWMLIYIYLLNSFTGYFTILFLLIFSALKYGFQKSKYISTLVLSIVITLVIIPSIYAITLFNQYHNTEKIEFNHLPEKTINGNLYLNDTLSQRTENGHYTDINICKKELKKAWESKSKLPYNGKDLKGQNLEETLIRYMTSKGLEKDSVGFAKLSGKDIEYIENGCANYLYTNKYSLKSRVYHVYWQLKTYSATGNPTAQSFSQRIEFLKAAKILIKSNFWTGIGSGDVMDSFKKTLREMGSKLEPDFYNRVHNQYIVEIIALGILGFVAFMIILIYPIFKYKIWNNYLGSVFYIIILISFLTDNPLETQLGVSFFTIFYCILLGHFVKNRSQQIKLSH